MDLGHILGKFRPIALKEMDAVELINRIDTKFVFHVSLLQQLLPSLMEAYQVLEIDGIRMHPYETLYFDDAQLSLYLHHHNQRGNRYKLRLRKYGSSSICFMEVKSKTNTGRTVKARSRTASIQPELSQEQAAFFREKTANPDGQWDFTTRICFNRITLVSLSPPERMTLDLNLSFADRGAIKSFDNLIVAEVKQGSKSPSAFIAEMKMRHIHPFSISKYCLGLSLLRPALKHNLFKRQQAIINKIQNKA